MYFKFGLIVMLVTLLALSAGAVEFISDDGTILSRTEVLEDDLYLFGNYTAIYGNIDGDLAAFCYDIKAEGNISGNADIFAYQADIGGRVENSVRAFGYNLIIASAVERNVIAVAKEIEIEKGAHIGRDLVCVGDQVSIDGTVLGNLTVYAEVVSISGQIDGNVKIEANEINIIEQARIGGKLKYTSKNEIYIDEDVVIEGETDWVIPEEKISTENDFSAIGKIFKFLFFIMALITGLVLIGIFNRHTRESTLMLEQRFGYSLAIGLLSMIIFTGGALILAVLIVGIPLSILLVCLGTALFYLGKIYVSIYLGRIIFRLFKAKMAMGWELLIGLIILSLLFQVPGLGVVIYVFSFILGTGAAVVGYQSMCRKSQAAVAATTSASASAS
jgi:cytoskeletal protein CcmA (bactofilin family)